MLSLVLLVTSCSSSGGVVPGAHIPDVEVFDIQGNSKKLRDVIAGSPTVINLWASWCGSCTEELPALSRLEKILSNSGIKVIGIGVQDDPSSITEIANSVGLRYPQFLDRSGELFSKLRLSGVPETFLVDSDGRFVLFDDPIQGGTVRLIGPRDWDSSSVIQRIRDAFKRSSIKNGSTPKKGTM